MTRTTRSRPGKCNNSLATKPALIKRRLPGFLIKIFPLIAKLKVLRGRVFDPFGKTRERKIERQLIDQFSADIRTVASHFSHKHLSEKPCSEKRYQLCVQFAAAPMKIKGFGHIKTLLSH
ncbi:DUF6537 domain-containing protein [Candidatus Spongiihabitans sp.]|uniref:DUF6537 domain-containing protein n=1 Tax=Candidatus Spongiihabitans sp. TaxID=3101308 RepID=UPI003C7DC970